MPEEVDVVTDHEAQTPPAQAQNQGAPDAAPSAEGQASAPDAPEENEDTSQEGKTESPEGVEAPPAAADAPKKKPWFQQRIDKLTAKNSALAAQLEQQLTRQRSGQAPSGPNDTPPAGAQPVNAEAVRLAAQMVAQERFNERCNGLVERGNEKFGDDFAVSLANMRAVGAVGPDADPTFISAVLELKDPAKVFHTLGKDPDEAARILSLSPTRQVIELARLEEKINKPKSVQISKTPAPITPVGGAAKSEPDLNDEALPIEQWIAQRDKTRRTRQ